MSSDPASSHLLENLLHFGRLLRRLGMRVSTTQLAELSEGLASIDVTRRDDFYHASAAFLVHSPEERDLFRQAFDLFWQGTLEWVVAFGWGSHRRSEQPALAETPSADEVVLNRPADLPADDSDTPPQADAEEHLTGQYSALETLRLKDFSDFTEEEMEAARRFIRGLVWSLDTRLTRRQVRALKRAGTLDLPRVVRGSLRQSGEIVKLAWRRRQRKPRPIVVLCDISGSMEAYSRLFLHFMYAMVQGVGRMEAFVFGTRLTRITPALRHKDVDAALREMSGLVFDWSGGTRIGESLKAFNFEWSRRVLGRGAVAIVISDGWDRGDPALLEREIARLSRSVSRLIWLNPLLGAPEYEPLVRGIRTVLPYVDDFLPLHNLASLERLADALGALGVAGRR